MSIKIFSIARLKIDNKDFILQDFSAIEEEYNEQLKQNEKVHGDLRKLKC